MSGTFQTQTLIYNVPFQLTYGKQYLVKATNPPNQITLGIKMYYTGAQYQFNVLSGGSIVLDGSHIMQVQLLTNIPGVIITEGANNLPYRDDDFNRNPFRVAVTTGRLIVPTGSSEAQLLQYSVPLLRKFEGHVYFFIGPQSSTALTGQAYEQLIVNGAQNNPEYYVEANAGSVLPIIQLFPVKIMAGENINPAYYNYSGQTLIMVISLWGLESDI